MSTVLSSLITQARRHLLELPSLSTPAAPVITNGGSAGSTAYSYKVVAANRDQTSIASAAGSTATGNATLTAANTNIITFTAVTGATYYRIYRTAGGTTQGLIGIVGVVTVFTDTGLAADSSTAPTAATGGTFWTDSELVDLLTNGAKDLWASILDTFGDHFLTIDETNVSLAASTSSLTGVPADVFRIRLIEPRDTTSAGTTRNLAFEPRKYNSPEFTAARRQSAVDPTQSQEICYDISGAGSPIGAPVILVAPQVTSAVLLRVAYNPTLGTLTSASVNPIPGESDNALIAWCVAFARAKERDDRSPDPSWISVYATEKQSILVRITPRQDQEPIVVGGVFDGWDCE